MLPASFDATLTRFAEERRLILQDRVSRTLGDPLQRLNAGTKLPGGITLWESDVVLAALQEYAETLTEDAMTLTREVFGSDPPPDAVEALRRNVTSSIQREAEYRAGWLHRRSGQKPGEREANSAATNRFTARALAVLDRRLAPLDIRRDLRALTPPVVDRGRTEADVFVCHASEDKPAVALPLSEALRDRGYDVWLDRFTLKLGDRLLERIDEGITTCRFGVVILSPSFFIKQWPKRELSGLAAREDAEDRTTILPVRYNLSHKELTRHSALLGAVLSADWATGIDDVVRQIVEAIGPPAAVPT